MIYSFALPANFNEIDNELDLKVKGAGSGIRARDFEIPQEARVNRITL